MEWTLSETIALANERCTLCQGMGMYRAPCGDDHPCECVLKKIFRACYARFRECHQLQHAVAGSQYEQDSIPIGTLLDHRRFEDYIADFCLVSRRALNSDQYLIFRYYFLLGADMKLCCHRLGIHRCTFDRNIRQIEQKLGRLFVELQPYGLYPLDEYFGGAVTKDEIHNKRLENYLRLSRFPAGADVPLKKIA